MAPCQVQDPKCVTASNKNILRKPNRNAIKAPYLRPKGIMDAIIGSTLGARKGINLNKKHPIKIIKIFILFFITDSYYKLSDKQTQAII